MRHLISLMNSVTMKINVLDFNMNIGSVFFYCSVKYTYTQLYSPVPHPTPHSVNGSTKREEVHTFISNNRISVV